MKGLNNMKNKAGFKVGDKVGYLMPKAGGLKSLKGLRGTIKYVNDIGAEVAFKTDRGVQVYALDNEDMIKVNNAPVTTTPTTPREMANDKNNVWAISIMPAPFDRERTVADLIVNGRIVDTATVSRWHDEDEYDVGTAAYEAIKKMFDIKDKAVGKVNDTAIKELEWFNGKVVCTYASTLSPFTKGKIYRVTDGVLTDDNGSRYHGFKNVIEINGRMNPQFIEVVA